MQLGQKENEPNGPAGLLQHHQQAYHHGEEGSAFHQCRGKDHAGAQVVHGFRLAGHGLYGVAADAADAQAGAQGCQTGANGRNAVSGTNVEKS